MQQGFPKKTGIITGASDPEISSEDGAGMVVAAFAVQREMDEAEAGSRVLSPRTAEELVSLGDGHFERYSKEEMIVLFQHLRELSMTQEDYDEREWRELQAQLCHRNIPITVFMDGLGTNPRISDANFSHLFHALWTKHQNRYRKMDWKVFHKQLVMRRVFV